MQMSFCAVHSLTFYGPPFVLVYPYWSPGDTSGPLADNIITKGFVITIDILRCLWL